MTRRRLLLAIATLAVISGTAAPALAGTDAPTHQICVGTTNDPNSRGHNAYCISVWR
jgi:hypothetical protein